MTDAIELPRTCPNCTKSHRAAELPDECVIAVLLGVLESRIERPLTQRELDGALALVQPGRLWDSFLGPVVDELHGYVAQHHANTRTPCTTCGTDTISDEVFFNTDAIVRCDVCGTLKEAST